MSLKRATFVALIIFWGFVAVLAFLAFRQASKQNLENPDLSPIAQVPSLGSTAMSNNDGTPIALSLSEVSVHNKPADCWMIISGSVYDITSFLPIHPGTSSVMIPFCGKDGTAAFQTQGGRGSHSNAALSLLPNYLIGKVGENLSVKTIEAKTQAASAATKNIPPGSLGESEDEEEND